MRITWHNRPLAKTLALVNSGSQWERAGGAQPANKGPAQPSQLTGGGGETGPPVGPEISRGIETSGLDSV